MSAAANSDELAESPTATSPLLAPLGSYREGLWLCTFVNPIEVTLPVEEQVNRIFADSRFVDCNDAMAQMYGFEKAADLSGYEVAKTLLPTEAQNREYLAAFVRSGYRLDGRHTIERARDGSTRHFVNALVGIVKDGMLTGAWGSQTDVTERQRLEEQARHAETMSALNRLAGGVAHDFNNILTTILTSIELLEESLDEDHAGRQDALEIRRAARRGAELTRQLLALSQQQVLVPRPGDVGAMVRRSVASMQRTLRPDLSIRTRLPEQPAIANIDGEEFEQVLLTLGAFTADSMPGPGDLEVSVDTMTTLHPLSGSPDSVPAGRYVVVTVTDTAPAFPTGIESHLFEPFFGVDLAGTPARLALATARGFVRQSGGAVVLDTPASGRRLVLYLPAAVMTSRPDALAGHAASARTVLLAEDEPTVRLLMKRVLQRAGYRVLVAANGEEAFELSRGYSGTIDALVTDVIMPGIGGGELSRRLRQERPGIRVLHVSGYTAGALRQSEALEDGAAFLQKPFTPRALIARLRELIPENQNP